MAVLNQPRGLPVLADYTRFVRRHRAIIAVLMGLGLVAGYAWSMTQSAAYSATTSVALTPVPVYVTSSTGELVAPEVSLDTDAQLLLSPVVLGAVGEALGTDADAAMDHLSVTAAPSSHVLHVTVSASSPEEAAKAADAAATALVNVRRDSLGALTRGQLRQLRLLVSDHERLLAQEQDRAVVIPEQDELFAQMLELRIGLRELEEARHVPAEVVRPAIPPTQADHANTEVPVMSGAMLGLLGGCLLGAGRDRTRLLGHPPTDPQDPPHPSGHLPDANTHPEEHDHAI